LKGLEGSMGSKRIQEGSVEDGSKTKVDQRGNSGKWGKVLQVKGKNIPTRNIEEAPR